MLFGDVGMNTALRSIRFAAPIYHCGPGDYRLTPGKLSRLLRGFEHEGIPHIQVLICQTVPTILSLCSTLNRLRVKWDTTTSS